MKRFWAYGMAWLLVLAGSGFASLPTPRLPEPASIRADACASSCAGAVADKFVAKHAGVSFQHDHHNWLTNVTTTVTGGPAWSVGYRYDASGNVTNLIYPGNRVVRYVFDADNRVTAVTDWNNRTVRFGYDARGRLTALTNDATGVTSSFGYDLENRVSSYQHRNAGGAFVARTLWRNAVGYKTQEDLNAGLNPVPPVAARWTASYDAADRLTSRVEAGGAAVSYAHDANGRQLSAAGGAGNTNVWDDDGRLVSVTAAGQVTQYRYDALGGRIGTISGTSTNYCALNYSAGLKNVLVEFNGAGVAQRFYLWGPAGLIGHVDADATTSHYYHADEQGSTLAITDTGGNVTDQFAYTPWGELTARTGTTATPYQWLGGVAVRTEANGLCYMLNRYYSVEQKRFISPDPSGLGGGANLYAYANLNPAFYTDPFGLCAEFRRLDQEFQWAMNPQWADLYQQPVTFNSVISAGMDMVGTLAGMAPGLLQAAGGVAEMTLGIGYAYGTGGFGAIAGGGALALHGLDQVQAGLRSAFSGSPVDSMTSLGLQRMGMSQTAANWTDAGIGMVGSVGVGAAQSFGRAMPMAARSAERQLTVIGHLKPPAGPGYAEVAESLGANYLKPAANWNWQKQGDFIKSVIERGDDVLIGTPIRLGDSVLRHEIKQLIKAGYRPAEQGSKLLIKKTR